VYYNIEKNSLINPGTTDPRESLERIAAAGTLTDMFAYLKANKIDYQILDTSHPLAPTAAFCHLLVPEYGLNFLFLYGKKIQANDFPSAWITSAFGI